MCTLSTCCEFLCIHIQCSATTVAQEVWIQCILFHDEDTLASFLRSSIAQWCLGISAQHSDQLSQGAFHCCAVCGQIFLCSPFWDFCWKAMEFWGLGSKRLILMILLISSHRPSSAIFKALSGSVGGMRMCAAMLTVMIINRTLDISSHATNIERGW